MKLAISAAAAVLVAGTAGVIVFRSSPTRPTPRPADLTPPLRSGPERPLSPSPSVSTQPPAGPDPRLLEIADHSGVSFTYYCDAQPNRFFLPETMGGGLAWIDFDADGLHDLFLVNGCRLPINSADRQYTQRLYRQRPDGSFWSIESLARVDFVAYGQGSAVGDVDNDGFPDLLVTCLGAVKLLLNRGDGTFVDQTEPSGIDESGWPTSAAFADLNGHGTLDLYVAHYVQTRLDQQPKCFTESSGVRVYCGPGNYDPDPDSLFFNRGDSTFVRTTDSYGVDPSASKGLGVLISDLDNDSRPDIYVANDMQANYLLHHRGLDESGMPRFDEVGLRSGAALSGDGRAEASMGVAAADFDDDGHIDIFLTHYYREKNTYYKNLGAMQFEDRSQVVGLAAPSLPFLGFGTVAIDYDLDGSQDLFVSNGHVLGKASQPYAMRPQLFRNMSNDRFLETTARAGAYFFQECVGRGAASCDFDNDGDEDIAVVHQDRPVALLRNDTERLGTPLGLRLVGSSSPRDGTGARVIIETGSKRRVRELVGGGSYLSAGDRRLTVGLPESAAPRVVVHWPSGRVDVWNALETGRYWQLVEGGVAVAFPPAGAGPAASAQP